MYVGWIEAWSMRICVLTWLDPIPTIIVLGAQNHYKPDRTLSNLGVDSLTTLYANNAKNETIK